MEGNQAAPEWRAIADEIWALVRENAVGLKALRKTQEENVRWISELQAKTDEQMKKTDKRIGELGNRFGEMVEYMVIPNLFTKFEELGFTFTKVNRTEI
jgi:hypothetical protein